jgi:hypothetical protein
MLAVCQLTGASFLHRSTSPTVMDPSGSGLKWPALISWLILAGVTPSIAAALLLSMAAVVKAKAVF